MIAPNDELVFAPLGGVGEIGMNLGIYGLGPERRRTWLAGDFGMSIAGEEHLPGVDLIYPDIRYLVEERKIWPASCSRMPTRTISARSSTCGRSLRCWSTPPRSRRRCCRPSAPASRVRPTSR